MLPFNPRLLLLILLLAGQPGIADTTGTLVSIRPLALLHQTLLPDMPAPDTLLPANTNLHDYALSASDLQRVHNAPVLLWLGSNNEKFLERLERRFANKNRWMALAPGSDHVWLDPAQLPALIHNMAEALTELHPQHSDQITSQKRQFLAALAQWQSDWQDKLTPFRQTPLVMGHDAFLSMARQLGLENVQLYIAGHSHGHRHGGTRDLLGIQQQLASGDIYCLVEEPDVSFRQLQRRYPQTVSVLLEPMAASYNDYLVFLNDSADKLLQCLQTE